MIYSIKNFSTFNINQTINSKKQKYLSIENPPKDSINFKGTTRILDKNTLELVKKLEKETPIIGFKGDGKWVLPNLRHIAGERFNLYLPDGRQISYQKSTTNDGIIFSLKTSLKNETTKSKISLAERDEHQENKRLLKTKSNNVLTFRISTKDGLPHKGDFKEGQIDIIKTNPDGTYSETSNITDNQYKKINEILNEFLPIFF